MSEINIEITGSDPDISVRREMRGNVWIDLQSDRTTVTLDPAHVRALAAALDAYEAAQVMEAAE